MSAATKQLSREIVQIQLRASAALNMQLAASLIGRGQEEMRKHFLQTAEVMMSAHAVLDAKS